MRRPSSLALRLILLFGIAAAIVFPLFGWVINRAVEAHFAEGDAAELEVIAQAVQEALTRYSGPDGLAGLRQRFDDILVGHHGASLYVTRNSGEVIYASPGPDLSAAVASAAPVPENGSMRRWNDGNHSYRMLVETVPASQAIVDAPCTLAVAVPIDYHLRFLAVFRQTLWLMIACSIVVMALMGWVAVRQGHAPLNDIVARIRRISADELSTRLPPQEMPYELKDLAVSFNEMLERVDTAFHRLSNFNADIAHELRTPITNLMTQTQVALSRARSNDEYREILYSNMEEYEHMAQMVTDMLFLARTENQGQIDQSEIVNLADEVRALFDYYEGWAEERGVALTLEGSAMVTGDRPMLRRALSNLLSNAIRHTPAGGAVRVKLAVLNGDSVLTVENPGPVIPAEHLPNLFDRFYRIDASRQRGGEGAGLGLAIVKSIITAHGGRVGVESTTGRTSFRIILPSTSVSAETSRNDPESKKQRPSP